MNTNFKMWSLYPFIARDVAVWVPARNASHSDAGGPEEVVKVIKDTAGEFLARGPELFDEFKKDGKTSYAFRLVFQSYDRTLTDAEVNDVMGAINKKIEAQKGWQVR